jgi:hypothetical protein
LRVPLVDQAVKADRLLRQIVEARILGIQVGEEDDEERDATRRRRLPLRFGVSSLSESFAAQTPSGLRMGSRLSSAFLDRFARPVGGWSELAATVFFVCGRPIRGGWVL